MDSVITPAMAALGALIAAWVGTRLGLQKFRQERAFDARLDWHRKLAETAKVLRNRTRTVGAFDRGGTPIEVALPLIKEVGELAFRFQELAETSALYATNRTHEAIRDVLAQMTKPAQAFAEYPEPQDQRNELQQRAQDLHQISLSGMGRVYDLLARDLRKMLDLEPLEEHRLLDSEDHR